MALFTYNTATCGTTRFIVFPSGLVLQQNTSNLSLSTMQFYNTEKCWSQFSNIQCKISQPPWRKTLWRGVGRLHEDNGATGNLNTHCKHVTWLKTRQFIVLPDIYNYNVCVCVCPVRFFQTIMNQPRRPADRLICYRGAYFLLSAHFYSLHNDIIITIIYYIYTVYTEVYRKWK